ncbi:hypothetical protein MKW92_044855 [Papaver armeniacum]|nr:hypothetical protein MKW92_044855 [Papaver armeniacum]
MDPLLSWAHEAHWSMGGLSFNRLKLQGRIEGNVKKLRSQQKKKLLSIKKSLENSDSKKTTPVRVSDLHHSSSPHLLPLHLHHHLLLLQQSVVEDLLFFSMMMKTMM